MDLHLWFNAVPYMPSEWNLHYARWVIEDGEPDRDVGESFEWFAVEFWSESGLVAAKDAGERSAVPGEDFKYLITHKQPSCRKKLL